LQDPISKENPIIKKKGAGGVGEGVGPEFKHQYHKQTNKNKRTNSVMHTKIIPPNLFVPFPCPLLFP
jgi:hypothetical protein